MMVASYTDVSSVDILLPGQPRQLPICDYPRDTIRNICSIFLICVAFLLLGLSGILWDRGVPAGMAWGALREAKRKRKQGGWNHLSYIVARGRLGCQYIHLRCAEGEVFRIKDML